MHLEGRNVAISHQRRNVNPKHVPVVAVTRHQSIPENAGGDSLPDWSQPFTEGSVEEPLAINQREETPHKTQNQFHKGPMLSQRVNMMCSLTLPKIPNAKFAR